MSMKLVVIIRDPGPMIWFQDPVEHRKVEIELTPEQEQQLFLRWVGYSGTHIHEAISSCFLEGDAPQEPDHDLGF